MFRFASPEYLYLLALVPLLAALFVIYLIRRKKQLERFGKLETIATFMPEASPRRIKFKFILVAAAIVFMILALARPQFGSKLKEVQQRGVEIMLAVDVSNSMLATDLEPTRLEKTKFAIDRLMEKLTEDRVWLIVFAGDAYVQLPITSDYLAARNFLKMLSPNMLSMQGTNIGAAIDLAANSFSEGSEGSRILIIITDGESHDDDPIASAKGAADKGIKIYTIGVGTPEGAPIYINGDFIKDESGKMVVSKLDEKTLEEIAVAGDGSYIRATNRSVGLTDIIARINEVEKKNLTAKVFEEYNEQYQYPLAFALFLLVVDMLIIGRKNRILARFNIFRSK